MAREKAIELCGEKWAVLKASEPDLVQAVLAGNYDTDIAMNNKVNLIIEFDIKSSASSKYVRA